MNDAAYAGSPLRAYVNLIRHYILATLNFFHLLLPARTLYNSFRYFFNINILLRNANFRKAGAPDGMPLPSPWLIHEVSGVYDQKSFFENGVQGANCIRKNLAKNNLSIDTFASILDFGCGCGRVLRHWRSLQPSRLCGTDYNPRLVNWCRENLPFAKCQVNTLSAHLDYADNQFDFIYAISVFTHLTEDLQAQWRDELYRILKSGGCCLFTFQGTRHQHKLTSAERELFISGSLVVQQERYPGMNTCQVYHPESYVRDLFGAGAEVVDFIPGGAEDAGGQDVVIVRKPA